MKLKRIFGEEMVAGANLKESIKHVLKISMIMSGTFLRCSLAWRIQAIFPPWMQFRQ